MTARTLSLLLIFLTLLACQATVTIESKPVTNETLVMAIRTIHIAELTAVTAVDGLTAGYKAHLITPEVLQTFQAVIAPRIQAALTTAKIAIKTAEDAPKSTPTIVILSTILELQKEIVALQGYYTEHALITQGTLP